MLQWFCLFPEKACPQFPAAELFALSHPAIERGTSVELLLQGANLEQLDQILISNGSEIIQQAIPEPVDASAPSPQAFRFSVPKDCAAGLFQARVVGRFGISNPRPLLITSKPVTPVQSSDHSDPALALPIRSGTIYHFVPQTSQKVYFRISLNAGENLHCVAYSQQLDSHTLPNLILAGPDLVELQRSRGVAGWPAEISYTAQQSGDHYLIAHDFLYRGGNGFSSLLEASINSPEKSSKVNLADPASQAQQLELDQLLRPAFSANLPDAEHGSPESLLYVANVDPEAESKKVETAEIPSAPFACHGSLQSGKYSIDFIAKGGKPLWLEVHSAALHQLTDPRLLLYRIEVDNTADSNVTESTKQQQLLENDDRPSLGGPDMRLRFRDPYVSWTPPEDGRYRLVIADQQRGKRPVDSMGFQLVIREATPGFELLAFHEYPNTNRQLARPRGVNLMRGDKICVRVMAVRRDGWKGAIEVVAEDLPDFLECLPAVIPESGNEITLVIESKNHKDLWVGELKILGRPLDNQSDIVRQAFAATVSLAATPSRNAIATRRTDCLYLASSPMDQAPLSFQAGGENPLEVVQGQTISIPIRVKREPEGRVAVLLRPRDLPPKSKLADLNIPADKDEGAAELVVARDTPPGTYTIWLQAEARLKWRKNPQALAAAEAELEALRKPADKAEIPAENSSTKKRIEQLEKRVELLRKSAAPQDLTTWIPTNLIRVRILPLDNTET